MSHAGLFTTSILIAAAMSMPTGSAFADEIVMSKDDCFDEVSERAKRRVDLGRRRGSNGPALAETELTLELRPLSSNEVQRVVADHLDGLQYCYDKAATRARAPSGEVSLAMSVDPSGRVTSIAVTAPGVNFRSLEKCIKAQVKRWRFPAANTVSQIDYPLVFDVAGPAH